MINEAVLASDIGVNDWKAVGTTLSNSSNWGFDRFRIYHPNWYTRVGLFTQAEMISHSVTEPNGQVRIAKEPINGSKMFSSGGSFEHDFWFDLSFNVNNNPLIIAFCGVPNTAEVQQIYATPTGYGATTGRNAEILDWDFSRMNTTLTGGGVTSSILWKNQPLRGINWTDTTTIPKLLSKVIEFQNCQLYEGELDKLLIWTDNGGQINGTLRYYGNQTTPSFASRYAYDNLIAKGWFIDGPAPPTS